MIGSEPTPQGRTLKGGPRSASRLGAVQALYQLEQAKASPELIVREFLDHRLGQEFEGVSYPEPDHDFFRDLVLGATTNGPALDERIAGALAADWPFERLEAVMRAILRAGTYELMFRPDVPTKAIINEYMNVAHAFFGGAEPGFANGVLDRLAREIRT